MSNKKFELVAESAIEVFGIKLFRVRVKPRIRIVPNFPSVARCA